MKIRAVVAVVLLVVLLGALPGSAGPPTVSSSGRARLRDTSPAAMPAGFVPAAATVRASSINRYFVVLRAPAVADDVRAGAMTPDQQRSAYAAARSSQEGAIAQAQRDGGKIVFRYGRLVNAFSAELSQPAARALAARADVASVEPVGVVVRQSNASTKFIGAPKVWNTGYDGTGMRVALVDTGIDYTHKDFGGPGTPEAYAANNPAIIERGSFPTPKVIGGYDFVGQNYDVLDGNPNNDIPVPDPDPLDADGHGTHTGGTCCGDGVAPQIQKGVAPGAKLYAIKVWAEGGSSTDDVLVAGYEFAVDPNQDGDTGDKADVLSFSGGVSYGTQSSVEAVAAQAVVDLGTVFVASAGNSGNQPSGGSAYITGTPANAPGVISVAAALDALIAATLDVNSPPGVVLPDNGLIVPQDWGADLTSPITTDLFDARAVDPPADPANPQPTDRMLCDPLPGTPLAGTFALIYKGSTGAGDCSGSTKVFNAELAGAVGVVLWSGFGGLPFGLASGGETITIPAVMSSTTDSEVLGDTISPDAASGTFNTVTVNVTINLPGPVPGFEDSMTDFTSEGPARVTNLLKPDITAPGADITSAGVGTGDQPAVLSGTSMAAPHVAGSAVLLRQIHPTWTPEQIKAALMNHATLDMKNNDLSTPVPATVMGAGRVQVDVSARGTSLVTPPSLSLGLRPLTGPTTVDKTVTVTNYDSAVHNYRTWGVVRYTDYNGGAGSVRVSLNGDNFVDSVSFSLAPGEGRTVTTRFALDPGAVTTAQQEFGWYYFHPGIDGEVYVRQTLGTTDLLHVPWHASLMATSANGVSTSTLDLRGGPATFSVTGPSAAGVSAADLYLLGGYGDVTTRGEEDIVAMGARSFTGSTINGKGSGLPGGTDAFAGITWTQFLTAAREPREPVEFGVEFYAPHDTTETLEVDVLVDAGADGVFADPGLRADYLVVKPPSRGGLVCVYDLSRHSPYDACSASYFADYSNYNSRLVGLAVDASAIGLTDAQPSVAYQVKACTGRFSGDVPAQICDTLGNFDGTTYTAQLNAVDPALQITPLVCGGFWGTRPCDAGSPATVTVGSAAPHSNPWILALFPNNPPTDTTVTLIATKT